jgi:hypothetical protein
VDIGRACLRAIGERLQQVGHLGVAVPFHEARHTIGLVTAARLADDRQRRSKNVGKDERASRGIGSHPLELRVHRLQPLPAVFARIPAASALRDNPLQAQLASLGEHERSLGRQWIKSDA